VFKPDRNTPWMRIEDVMTVSLIYSRRTRYLAGLASTATSFILAMATVASAQQPFNPDQTWRKVVVSAASP
jgi:hypothetical protein